jgi:signal transduction histidine kinase
MARALPLPAAGRPPRIAWPGLALVATLAAGLVVERSAHPGDAVAAAGDLAVALAFVGCGAAVWAQPRSAAPPAPGMSARGAGAESASGSADLTGPLMIATGVAWLAGSAADELALLHRGPLVQLLVTAPGGRPQTRAEWVAVAVGWAAAVVPGAPGWALLGLALAGAACARWGLAAGALRRARAVPAAAAVALAVVVAVGAVAPEADADTVLWGYQATLVAIAAALYADLRWGSWTQSAVTSLVIDLGDARSGSLAATVAHAVGDPSLRLGYRAAGGYVDEQGRALALPPAGADAAVTTVEAGGAPAAVLVHDPATLRAPGLADAVTAVVRVALENARLQDDIRARVRDVEASRARLLRARDTERGRLDARLRAGVARRLDAAAACLADAPADLRAELDRTREEVHRFAHGLRPHGLEAGGLAAALPELAAGAPLPVEVDVRCGRVDGTSELAAWFVCSEGLANVAKHAAATRATVTVAARAGRLEVTVEDDGRGGADATAGRGLRGLAARVEAAGGGLSVADRPGGGTRLHAWLPAKERA